MQETIAKTDVDALGCVDTERFPLRDPDSATYRLRVTEAREALEHDGCCVLRGLIRPDALPALAEETAGLAPKAHFTSSRATVYGNTPNPDHPEGDPRRVEVKRDNGFVAGDFIPDTAQIRQLYHDADFRRFVGACLGLVEIHEFGDPLAQLVVNVLKPGTGHGWHFDSNEFIVTLLTQPPDEGGSFDYCPQIRRPGSENYDEVGAVLEGDESQVKFLDLRAGDLQIFFGRYSLHRVSTIRGSQDRHTVIFAYSREPGRLGNPEKTKQIFGRVTGEHASSAKNDDGLNG
ncbi:MULTISPECIES: hypothetical protein [unclassified Mameliella]|uniref:HalD/BesD family halogenase n=1 Tax=unclassified Mameliella TaxID=2630630 RepID=UPI00273E04A4|nr:MULTISPECIES: hypothetical protein [unclassified Mameliella]